MSQPCSMVGLVLVDAAALADSSVRKAVTVAVERGTHLAAITDRPDIAEILSVTGDQERFGLWFSDSSGEWPFSRAARMTGVEPEHTLFISNRDDANTAATTAGIRTCDPDQDDIDRYLG